MAGPAGITARRWFKPLVFFTALLPLAWLLADGLTNHLSANPIDDITDRTGIWALRFLLLSLLATPLRRWTGRPWPLRLRRMLGLFAFFYACLHLLTWLVLDQFFNWTEILSDIAKRPFITLGLLAFLALVPLAATSTRAAVKRLGPQWRQLHRLAYLVPVLVVIHFWWSVKADIREPLLYAMLVALLLAVRLLRYAPMGASRSSS